MLALLLMPAAHAAGYHLARVDAIYGTGGSGVREGGFGASLLDDQLVGVMTFGDPDVPGDSAGYRLKQAWLEGSWYGYQLGDPPMALLMAHDGPWAKLDRPVARDDAIFGYSFGRFGADHTTRRNLVADWSQHVALSIPGLWGVAPRHVHFGPTAGVGLNLTWWDRWRGTSDDPSSDAYGADYVVNTGKVTAEAGWLAGATWLDALYVQGRATAAYDLFGIHQTDLDVAGVVGGFLGRLGEPFGAELRGELDAGTDNVTALYQQRWSVQAVVFWKASFPAAEPDAGEMQHLIEMLHQIEADRDADDAPKQADASGPSDVTAWDADHHDDSAQDDGTTGADSDAGDAGTAAPDDGGTSDDQAPADHHDPRQGPEP